MAPEAGVDLEESLVDFEEVVVDDGTDSRRKYSSGSYSKLSQSCRYLPSCSVPALGDRVLHLTEDWSLPHIA